jgi:hypothetical protein
MDKAEPNVIAVPYHIWALQIVWSIKQRLSFASNGLNYIDHASNNLLLYTFILLKYSSADI